MDLETVADELYGVPPDEFVALRTERVKQARTDGDRPLAKSIGQLARPTRSAWLVNVLAREASDDLGGLLELGAALSDAQRRLSGPDLRRLSGQRHAAVEALVRRAVKLGTERGHTATEATRLEVSQTLQAALADPATGKLVQTGRAVKAVTYGGFGPTEFLTAVPPLTPDSGSADDEPGDEPEEAAATSSENDGPKGATKAATTKKATGKAAAERKELERKRSEANEAVASATAELDKLREAQASANSDLKRSAATADELTELVSSLRDQFEEAKGSERAARESVRFARKQVQQLKEATGDAESAVRQARDQARELN